MTLKFWPLLIFICLAISLQVRATDEDSCGIKTIRFIAEGAGRRTYLANRITGYFNELDNVARGILDLKALEAELIERVIDIAANREFGLAWGDKSDLVNRTLLHINGIMTKRGKDWKFVRKYSNRSGSHLFILPGGRALIIEGRSGRVLLGEFFQDFLAASNDHVWSEVDHLGALIEMTPEQRANRLREIASTPAGRQLFGLKSLEVRLPTRARTSSTVPPAPRVSTTPPSPRLSQRPTFRPEEMTDPEIRAENILADRDILPKTELIKRLLIRSLNHLVRSTHLDQGQKVLLTRALLRRIGESAGAQGRTFLFKEYWLKDGSVFFVGKRGEGIAITKSGRILRPKLNIEFANQHFDQGIPTEWSNNLDLEEYADQSAADRTATFERLKSQGTPLVLIEDHQVQSEL